MLTQICKTVMWQYTSKWLWWLNEIIYFKLLNVLFNIKFKIETTSKHNDWCILDMKVNVKAPSFESIISNTIKYLLEWGQYFINISTIC